MSKIATCMEKENHIGWEIILYCALGIGVFSFFFFFFSFFPINFFDIKNYSKILGKLAKSHKEKNPQFCC
jgi:hypothetical protein